MRLGGLGEPLSVRVCDFVPAGLDLDLGAKREDRPERRSDHLLTAFRRARQRVERAVDPASLPTAPVIRLRIAAVKLAWASEVTRCPPPLGERRSAAQNLS